MKEILSQLLYPDNIKCIICDRELPYETEFGICDKCKLPYNTKYCLRCGRALDNLAPYCDICMDHNQPFDLARAPFLFNGNIRKLVHKLKYGHGQYLAPYLANFMLETYYEMDIEPDFITYVPMPHKREKQRGYNQAKLLAIEIAKKLNIHVVDSMQRNKYVKNLARLNRHQRAESIKGSIDANPDVIFKGKKILLIDDVMTSGATINECCHVLRHQKVKNIYVLTLATSKFKPLVY